MSKLWPKLASIVLVAAVTFLLFFGERNQGLHLMSATGIAAIAWWFTYRNLAWKEALTIGILMRFGALFAFPLLSDDIYRFLWDGELWLAGYHPLDFIPSEAPSAFAKTHSKLLARMNSAGYYTVYPPISQLVFTFGAWLGSSVETATMWLKLPLFIGELAVLRFLFLMDKKSVYKGVSAYALLPLPIIEIVGNAHFEGLAVLGVLGAIYYFRNSGPLNFLKSGLWLGFGVLAKLVPLLAAPAIASPILWQPRKGESWDWKKGIGFGASLFISVAIGMMLFLLQAELSGFGESLNLYFQKFEFNGSLYVFASVFGKWYKGWNWIAVIGPSLSILSMVSILTLAFVRGWKKLDLATTLLFSFGIYILCATTVHPWYTIYLIALAPLTKYKWPYVLSFSVFLSYLAYGTVDVVVPLWATILEYGSVLAVLLFEVQQAKAKSS